MRWGDRRRGDVGLVSLLPVEEIAAGDCGHGGVEFDADDLPEREFACDQQGAAFACADVGEGVAVDGVGGDGVAPELDEGAEDAGGDAVVGGDVGVVGMSGDKAAGGDEAAGVYAVGLVEGMDGAGGGLEEVVRALFGGHVGLAELDEAGVAVEAQDAASLGGDLCGIPSWRGEEGDGRLAYLLKACEAIGDLGFELRFGGFCGVGQDEVDLDAMFFEHAGDAGSGGFEVRRDGDVSDEAEIDDVAGEFRVVAVVKG